MAVEFTPQQRSWCVLEFAKSSSPKTVQRKFKQIHHIDPPTRNSILNWYKVFKERGCICDQRKKNTGRPTVSEEVVENVRTAFLQDPTKSLRNCSQELQIPKSTVSKIKKNLQTRKKMDKFLQLKVQKL